MTSITPVHVDLVCFWVSNGAGTFNRDREGRRVNDMIANRLLDAEEVRELVEGETYDIADILKLGIPFFNTLDREFIAIADDGEIVQATPLGEKRHVSATLEEFISRLLKEPLFYESHLSGEDFELDDVL